MDDIEKQLSELGSQIPVTGSTEMKATVTLIEMYGRVRIIWDIDNRYPINNAVAQVVEVGNTNYYNHVIPTHQGYFDTKFTWGRGYAGVLWGWNEHYIHIVSTPVTS